MLRSIIMLVLAGLVTLPCRAQNEASPSEKKPSSPQTADAALKGFYSLNFVVQELENDRVINSRSYSLIMRDVGQGAIRAGEKVPFSSTTGGNAQWTQINVGVNIDCRKLEVTGNRVSLEIKAEISSVMEGPGENSPAASLPIIRNNQWESNVVLPLRQPSVLFTSDDPASKRTMRLQLTVTPIQ